MRLPGPFRILRPANALVSAAGAYVGALLAGAAYAPPLAVGAAMLAAFAFAAAGNVRNDITDVEIDRRAHPTRPLVTGEVSPSQARSIAIGLYLVALAAGALVSWIGFLLVLVAIPIMEGYERVAKQRGLVGNGVIGALTGAPFVLGGLAGGALGVAVLAVAGLAACATTAREILKDVEDLDADRGRRVTLPMRIGARGAGLCAIGSLVATILLSPLPWLLETVLARRSLVALVPADVLFLAAAATSLAAPSRAQRLAKLGMVAALAALIVGRVAR
jgi:geranylgeranylglycerol-phosphate geranylgeranyltransferase